MRVLLADDHPLFRDGLATLLRARGMEVVGEAGTAAEAVRELSVALVKHLVGHPAPNILMIGNSGTGKTTIMRAMEKLYADHGEFSKYRVVVVMNANQFASDKCPASSYLGSMTVKLRIKGLFGYTTLSAPGSVSRDSIIIVYQQASAFECPVRNNNFRRTAADC